MPNTVKGAVAPVYLLACLVLGGSVQGVWQNAVLQLAGIAIIAWSAAAPGQGQLARPVRMLLLLFLVATALVALQLVPLPPAFWSHGVRAGIANGYSILGRPVPWLPLSVAPFESLDAFLHVIPPLAVFCAMVRLKAYRQNWLAAALLAGATAETVLGVMQVAGGGKSTFWYPYAETNLGVAVGFFANANHMASLLVLSFPFAAALIASAKGQDPRRHAGLILASSAVALVLVVGIALCGSLAGYSLAVPVLALSAVIIVRRGGAIRRVAVGIAILSAIAAVAALATSGVGSEKFNRDATGSVQSREALLKTTGKAISDFMPLGSGLGSFVQVYRLYESPESVTNEYVIHAHNDYAEIALELGIPGILLVLLFGLWWVVAVGAVWRRGEGGAYAQAASVASGAVLVHSLVDFPLRTAAISASFAMCLALLADRREPRPREVAQLRPARHLVFE